MTSAFGWTLELSIEPAIRERCILVFVGNGFCVASVKGGLVMTKLRRMSITRRREHCCKAERRPPTNDITYFSQCVRQSEDQRRLNEAEWTAGQGEYLRRRLRQQV
jgi:hypothetical protein